MNCSSTARARVLLVTAGKVSSLTSQNLQFGKRILREIFEVHSFLDGRLLQKLYLQNAQEVIQLGCDRISSCVVLL